MSGPLNPEWDGVGFLLAIAIGFLVGRTRAQAAGAPKPGIRDFVIIAALGGLCARLDLLAVTVALASAMTGVLLVTRWQHPERTGVTTELAALTTFLLGYLCLTPLRPLGAALGIILAGLLTAKEELHQFALRTISQREFGDTLKFLALIFVSASTERGLWPIPVFRTEKDLGVRHPRFKRLVRWLFPNQISRSQKGRNAHRCGRRVGLHDGLHRRLSESRG